MFSAEGQEDDTTVNTDGDNPINLYTLSGDINMGAMGAVSVAPSKGISLAAGETLSAVADGVVEVISRKQTLAIDASDTISMYAGGSTQTTVQTSILDGTVALTDGISALLNVRDCSAAHQSFCSGVSLDGVPGTCTEAGSGQCAHTAATAPTNSNMV